MSQTILNLGCGDDHHSDAINVDANPAADPDVRADLSQPWPWDDDSVDIIRAYHVFEHLPSVEHALREAARVLRPGGACIVKWPMGLNEIADPDHKHRWSYESPAYYTGARPWDVDVGLTVVSREIALHSNIPGLVGHFYQRVLRRALSHWGAGRWAFDMPITSGEFTVVYRA